MFVNSHRVDFANADWPFKVDFNFTDTILHALRQKQSLND